MQHTNRIEKNRMREARTASFGCITLICPDGHCLAPRGNALTRKSFPCLDREIRVSNRFHSLLGCYMKDLLQFHPATVKVTPIEIARNKAGATSISHAGGVVFPSDLFLQRTSVAFSTKEINGQHSCAVHPKISLALPHRFLCFVGASCPSLSLLPTPAVPGMYVGSQQVCIAK